MAAGVSFGTAIVISNVVIGVAVVGANFALSRALTKKPKLPSFSNEAQGRSVTIRSPTRQIMKIIFKAILGWLGSSIYQLATIFGAKKYGEEVQRRKQSEATLDAIEYRNKQDAEIKSKKRESVIGRIMRK